LPELLAKLRAHNFFCLAPPKSTGREIFNLAWLESQLPRDAAAANVQATLLALTTGTIADAIARFCATAREVYLCGGGVRNAALVQQLAEQLKDRKVAATDVLGIDAEHVEALAFAWLAKQTNEGKTGNLPSVTGARDARVLGAIYRK
jgi:anhydro-N-acetylmuramic acid kinase